MTPTITYVNGATLPRVPHRWLAGGGPCHDCGAAVGEIHRELGCPTELCPQCFVMWRWCSCKTIDVIPQHGLKPWYPREVHDFEDGNGRSYEMRVQEDEE